MALLATTASIAAASTVGAVGHDVIFSEIMYHAADGTTDDDDDYDYVELFNNGDASVDLLGWTFTEGFDFEFLTSFVLAPGEFAVIAQNASAFEERYGFAPDAEFADGKLKNSSEDIELTDNVASVVDFMEYNDDPPWPGGADGNGPALERLDLDLPNTGNDADAANWLASFAPNGTPGAENSVAPLLDGPSISSVDDGNVRPVPGTPVAVTAAVSGALNVSIEYVVMFEEPQTMPMFDDTTSAGGAGDGVFSVELPAQEAHTLVRYRVIADGLEISVSSPATNDTIGYHGFVTADPAAPIDPPQFDWFMDPVDHDDMFANHRFDNVKLPGVVAFGDQVIDNARFRVRGNVTRVLPKPSLKVEMPNGHLLSFGSNLAAPIDEFNLYRSSDPGTNVGWEIADEIGLQAVDFFAMRVYLNGDFWSAGAYLTATDGRYRDAAGYGDAAVYKADGKMKAKSSPELVADQWEKKEGADDDFTDIWELTQIVDASPTPAQFDQLMEELDIPAVINYWVYIGFVQQSDAGGHNHFVIRDPEGSGRWHADLWDLSIFDHNKNGILWSNSMTLIKTLNQHVPFRAMYERRLKTVVDTYSAEQIIDRYNAYYDIAEAALLEDDALWDHGPRPSVHQSNWAKGVRNRYSLFAANTEPGSGRRLPLSQSSARPIEIASATGSNGAVPDLIELVNNSADEAFDLSDWTLDTIGFDYPAGTILLPGESVTISSDDIALRDSTDNLFSAGQFDGPIPGGILTLRDKQGAVVDTLVHDPTGDIDEDGIPTQVDNCPVDANADQADGDGDGIGDLCDLDPNDGPTGDPDGDGVVNNVDNCPVDANVDQADADFDGIGDACDPETIIPDTTVTVQGSGTAPTVTVNALDGALDVSWLPVANAQRYRYRIREATGPWSAWIHVGSNTSVLLDGLTNRTEYTLAVSTRVANKWKAQSTEATLAPLALDTDSDGIGDPVDNCPVDANADQTDTDSDGIGDACDPDNSDGPTGDTDNDTITNNTDNCPNDPNTDQTDTDSDGIGDACDPDNSDGPTGDTDGDGITNDVDNCPADVNTDQTDTDGDGIGDVCDPVDDSDQVVEIVGTEDSPTIRVVVSAGSLRTEWDEVDGATQYQFRHRRWRQAWMNDTPGVSFERDLTALNPAVRYTIAVRAKTNGMWKPWTTAVVTSE